MPGHGHYVVDAGPPVVSRDIKFTSDHRFRHGTVLEQFGSLGKPRKSHANRAAGIDRAGFSVPVHQHHKLPVNLLADVKQQEALQLAQNNAQQFPQSSEVHTTFREVHVRLENQEKAEQTLRLAAEKRPILMSGNLCERLSSRRVNCVCRSSGAATRTGLIGFK